MLPYPHKQTATTGSISKERQEWFRSQPEGNFSLPTRYKGTVGPHPNGSLDPFPVGLVDFQLLCRGWSLDELNPLLIFLGSWLTGFVLQSLSSLFKISCIKSTLSFEMVAEGLVQNKAVHFRRMYLYRIQTEIIPEALPYIQTALIESSCVGIFSPLFLNSLSLPETVDPNEKLYMGTDGASIKHLERPGTAQPGWKAG